MKPIVALLKEKDAFYSGAPATEKEVVSAEKELGTSFAEEYKDYLLAYGIASYSGHELTGICKSSRLNVISASKKKHEAHPSIPNDWYVVEDTNMDGVIIWQSQSGEIFRSGSLSDYVKIADSLSDYIEDDFS